MPLESGKFTSWGPYLSFGADPSREMIIAWRDGKEKGSGKVHYGTTPDMALWAAEEMDTICKSHVVHLRNLEPGTVYHYRVEGQQESYTFHTAAPPGSTRPFEFVVNGDMHAYPCNNLGRYFDLMNKVCPDHEFYVGVGDFINDGNNDEHWNAFFHDAATYLHTRPLMNATGNHDTSGITKYRKYLEAWPHPYVNPKMGGYYSFVYHNAVFVMIDSCNAGHWSPTPSDEQYEWLEGVLETHARKDKWVFLFMHHQVYSTGDFSCDPLMEEVFRPLCQEYHVDAVFYGHDHHYEAIWVDRDEDWGGTLYFVAGAGGGQNHVDFSIMGPRGGRTKYIWPGRFLNVRKHGIPPAPENIPEDVAWFRNDELIGKCQLFGVLEPNIVHVKIQGDVMDLRAIGWQEQVFHHLRVRRAGTGRRFTGDSEIVVMDY